VADYKADRYPGVETLKIQSTHAVDGGCEARLERLRGEEMSRAGEIEIQGGTRPSRRNAPPLICHLSFVICYLSLRS
jgi:hypothetical protein